MASSNTPSNPNRLSDLRGLALEQLADRRMTSDTLPVLRFCEKSGPNTRIVRPRPELNRVWAD